MTIPQTIENTSFLRWRRILVALGVFIGIVAAVNWQLIIHLSTHVIGRPIEDAFEVLWEMNWAQEAIFKQGVSPLFSPNIFYPHGWYLASGAQPVWWMVAIAPVAQLLGTVLTYNLVILATFVIGAFGVFLLVDRFTHNPFAGILAGCVYAVAPVLTLRQGGHLHILLSAQWLPYLALFCQRSLEVIGTNRKREWLIAAVFWALSLLGHWQFVFIAPLVPLCVIGFMPARARWRERLWLMFRMGFVALLLVAPFALYAAYARGQMFTASTAFPLSTQDAYSMSLDRLLVPSPSQPLWGEWSRQTFPVHGEMDVVSIGYLATALALIGGLRGLPAKRPYIFLAALAVVCAAGITLHWNSQPVELTLSEPLAGLVRVLEARLLTPDMLPPGNRLLVPLPMAVLVRLVPFVGEARAWARYMIAGMLGIAVLAGLGAHVILMRWSKHARPLLVAMTAVVLLEGLVMPYGSFTEVASNTRKVDLWLSAQRQPVSLVEYPLPYASKLALYREAVHGQKVVNGYMSVDPTYYTQAASILGQWPTDAAVELLRQWNINYVIINGTSDEKFLKETLPSIQAVRGLCLVRTDDEPELQRRTYAFEILGIDQRCNDQS